jgi:hypothetical protein
VFVLLVTKAMSPLDAWQGFIGDENLQPYAIIVLFFSLAYVCVSLDMTGTMNISMNAPDKIFVMNFVELFFNQSPCVKFNSNLQFTLYFL